MTSIVPVYINKDKNRYIQKCVIPSNIFKTLNIAVGDYVMIQSSNGKFICRVHSTVLPYSCIYVDNIVASETIYSNYLESNCATIKIPDDLKTIKTSNFERIMVKVVYNNENIIHCEKIVYEDIIYKILKGYVIEKNCEVNCNGLKVADFFHIYRIVVSETFPETDQYGKLTKSTKIEIIDLMSTDQFSQIQEFQCLRLGGINETLNVIKSYLYSAPTRILVSGPQGSGKTSLIKKFLSDTNCFFTIIDGLKDSDLTCAKCDLIYKQFFSYLKIFPNHLCLLCIDHADLMSPNSLKTKTSTIAALVNLVNRLSDLSVSVIIIASHRRNINFKLSSLFVREVTIGMPSFQQRKEMLRSLTESLSCDIDFDKITQITPGFVAHDIHLLFQEALNKSKTSEKSDLKNLTTEDFLKAATTISPSILKASVWNMKVKPVHWKDIGGMFDIKQRLQMCIEWPLRNPDIFKKVDLPCPRGVLLFGPPGCCKTTLARGLATECNANFFSATPAQIYSSYVGESEKNITELFYQARLSAPSIIFLDEIDSLVSQRKLDQKSQGIGEKVLSALLNEMDGFGTKVQYESSLAMQRLLNSDEVIKNINDEVDVVEQQLGDDVIVVAATNRPDLIDDALLRPGRFDIILYVPPPNEEERVSILQTLTKHKPIQNVDMKHLAETTKLFSGADLKLLCNEAAMNALRQNISAQYITEEHFLEALKKIQPSITKQQIQMYEKLSSKYGTFIK